MLSNKYPVYPLLSKFNIQEIYPLYIQLLYPNLFKYIHLYPIKIPVSDILDVILFGYPVQEAAILS